MGFPRSVGAAPAAGLSIPRGARVVVQAAGCPAFGLSHLQGLFYRTLHLLENGIKPVFVFDGRPPDLKQPLVGIRGILGCLLMAQGGLCL